MKFATFSEVDHCHANPKHGRPVHDNAVGVATCGACQKTHKLRRMKGPATGEKKFERQRYPSDKYHDDWPNCDWPEDPPCVTCRRDIVYSINTCFEVKKCDYIPHPKSECTLANEAMHARIEERGRGEIFKAKPGESLLVCNQCGAFSAKTETEYGGNSGVDSQGEEYSNSWVVGERAKCPGCGEWIYV